MGLEFDESKHLYTINGVVVPSVTQIMRPLSEMHYGGINDSVMQNAANRGTAIHESIENYLKFGFADCPPEYKGYIDAFTAWNDAFKSDVIASEIRIYHDVMIYAGTADLLCKINGANTLVDYKSTATLSEMLVRMQLTAYAQALRKMGYQVDKVAALHLMKNGKYEYVEYDAFDVERFKVFGALKTVYDYTQKYNK